MGDNANYILLETGVRIDYDDTRVTINAGNGMVVSTTIAQCIGYYRPGLWCTFAGGRPNEGEELMFSVMLRRAELDNVTALLKTRTRELEQ